MTTLAGRPRSALLVIDVQNGVLDGAHDRDGVIGRIGQLVARARAEDVPVVWVQHHDEGLPEGSEPWRYVPELGEPAAGEALVGKAWGDAFEETGLEEVLAGHRVGRVVITGASTEACVRATLHGAAVRGYDVTLVTDAHTTGGLREWGGPSAEVLIAFTNLYWTYHAAPGRRCDTAPAASVELAPVAVG